MKAKPFLKSLGMEFDIKPAQLNHRFYKSLSEEQQKLVEEIWDRKIMGVGTNPEIYVIPETMKQAIRLYSLDARRYVESLGWFHEVASLTRPKRVYEVGAGAGVTSGFLKQNFPGLDIAGIEQHPNLAEIAVKTFGGDFQVGNYLEVEGCGSHDLVICDFGFDVENLAPSMRPHSIAEVNGHQYCPGCAEDMGETLKPYFAKWASRMSEGGKLAVAGRFAHVGMMYGALVAAEAAGLRPVEGLCTNLRTVQDGIKQNFPALTFERGEMDVTMEAAAYLYSL